MRAIQEHATGHEAMAGYLGECAAPGQAQRDNDAPVIDLLRRGVANCARQRPFTHGTNEGLASTRRQRLGVGESFRDRCGIDTNKRHAHGDRARESPAPHLVHAGDDPPPLRQ